jgi:integrase
VFLAAKEVDDLYHYMALLRASWMRGGEAANLHRSDITVIYAKQGDERVVKEMIFRIRDSKTDIDGDKAVSQMVKTDLAPHLSDIRELIPRLQKADDFVFPNMPAQYRRRMRGLWIQIADEQPDLIPDTQIDVEDYGLHSWRKMGATLAAAAGMHDYEIMEYGRWKSLEFTKYAPVRQHDAAEHVRLALGQNLEVL